MPGLVALLASPDVVAQHAAASALTGLSRHAACIVRDAALTPLRGLLASGDASVRKATATAVKVLELTQQCACEECSGAKTV